MIEDEGITLPPELKFHLSRAAAILFPLVSLIILEKFPEKYWEIEQWLPVGMATIEGFMIVLTCYQALEVMKNDQAVEVSQQPKQVIKPLLSVQEKKEIVDAVAVIEKFFNALEPILFDQYDLQRIRTRLIQPSPARDYLRNRV